MKFIRPLAFCLVLLPMSSVQADPRFGVNVSATRPFSSETRKLFGSVLPGFGIGFGTVVPEAGGHFGPDFIFTREEKNSNKIEFYGIGAQYRRTFSDKIEENTRFVPFYGAGVGGAYGRTEIPGNNIKDSKIVPGGTVFLGTSIGKRGIVEARVRALPDVGGINFSGLSLTAGIRF